MKDQKGKTQIHVISYQNLGKVGVLECDCPLKLASDTVQSILGQLKSIFEAYGKGKVWDEKRNIGNPVSSVKMKKYLDAIKREQAVSHTVVKQAKPMFIEKVNYISKYIESKLMNVNSPAERYVLLRDQAFFKLQYFAGDRASDLGKSLTQEIKRLDGDLWFVITHTVRKTLENGKKNEFCIMRTSDSSICPVLGIERYVSGSAEMGNRSRKHVLDIPVSHSAMYTRLKFYLKQLGIDEGETPHSSRGGCAIPLNVSECGTSRDIMEHVGWFSQSSYNKYSRMTSIADKTAMGSLFSNVLNTPNVASVIFEKYGDVNKLPSAF